MGKPCFEKIATCKEKLTFSAEMMALTAGREAPRRARLQAKKWRQDKIKEESRKVPKLKWLDGAYYFKRDLKLPRKYM
jgi:hypothetical protein